MADNALQRVGGQVPGPTMAWVLTGAGVLGLGLWTMLTGFLALYDPQNMGSLSLRFLPTGLPMVCMGSGLLGLGIIKRKAVALLPETPALPPPAEYRDLILPLLTGENATVADLIQQTALTEGQVIQTLNAMEKRGEIQEELNTDTGQYFYLPTDSTGRPLSLQERIDRQEKP